MLDVGCGPFSLLWRLALKPVGVDRSTARIRAYRSGGLGCVGSAAALPFAAGTFDAVASLGMLHHLGDDEAARALAEMRRVTKPGGPVVVFDAVLPEPAWRRPLAWAIRQADRGGFMRGEAALCELLSVAGTWHVDRFTYAATGLEGVVCVQRR